MKVLVACEFSGIVREAFKKRGHDAWSCDLLDTEIPGNHIKGDVLEVLDRGWDLMIAHPPCTYLTVTGNKWMKPEYAGRFPTRQQDRQEAIAFFIALTKAPVARMALENPIGIMSTQWRRPDQIIQPWHFGDKAVKKTCLWLINLPPLFATSIVEPEYIIYNSATHPSGKSKYPVMWKGGFDGKDRSVTYKGIADAMAEQWGSL